MANYIFYPCSCEELVRYACEIILGKDFPDISTEELINKCGNVVFADTTIKLQENGYFGHKVIPQEKIADAEFDRVFILSPLHLELMYNNLTQKYNVPENKIERGYMDYINRAREKFVFNVAQMQRKKGLSGDVAEGGVFRGDFSKIINAAYPESKLYLFDTFEGFDERDYENDIKVRKVLELSGKQKYDHYANTSVELVLGKLPFPEKAVVRKGYFPETAGGVDGEFVLVNLDFDLYAPIKAGLEFFYPKMKKGGVIMVHDYYNHNFDADRAVDEFCGEHGLIPISIGDLLSVAIVVQ